MRFRGIVWVLVKRGVEAGDGAVMMGVYLFLGMLCFRVRIRVRLGLFRVIEDRVRFSFRFRDRLGLFRVSFREKLLNAEVHATRKYN